MPLGEDQWETVSEAHRRIKNDPSHTCRDRTCGISYTHAIAMPWQVWRRAKTTSVSGGLIFDLDRGYLNPDTYYKYLVDLTKDNEEEASMPTRTTGRERFNTFARKGSHNPFGDDPETTGLRVTPEVILHWLSENEEIGGVLFTSSEDDSLPRRIIQRMCAKSPMEIEYHIRMLGCAMEPYDRCVFISLDPNEDRDLPWVAAVTLKNPERAHELHLRLTTLLQGRFYTYLKWYSQNRERLVAEQVAQREARANSPEAVESRIAAAASTAKRDALADMMDIFAAARGMATKNVDMDLVSDAISDTMKTGDAPAAIQTMLKMHEEREYIRRQDRRAAEPDPFVAEPEYNPEPGTYPLAESDLAEEEPESGSTITGEKGENS